MFFMPVRNKDKNWLVRIYCYLTRPYFHGSNWLARRKLFRWGFIFFRWLVICWGWQGQDDRPEPRWVISISEACYWFYCGDGQNEHIFLLLLIWLWFTPWWDLWHIVGFWDRRWVWNICVDGGWLADLSCSKIKTLLCWCIGGRVGIWWIWS